MSSPEDNWNRLSDSTKYETAKQMEADLASKLLPFIAGKNRGLEEAATLVDECTERDPTLAKVAAAIRELKL